MKRHQKNSAFKFAVRTHSRRGIAGLILGLLSIGAGFCVVALSYRQQGQGEVYLGEAGILSLLCGLAAFLLAVRSLREEAKYRIFPVLALLVGILSLGGWIFIYVLGC